MNYQYEKLEAKYIDVLNILTKTKEEFEEQLRETENNISILLIQTTIGLTDNSIKIVNWILEDIKVFK